MKNSKFTRPAYCATDEDWRQESSACVEFFDGCKSQIDGVVAEDDGEFPRALERVGHVVATMLPAIDQAETDLFGKVTETALRAKEQKELDLEDGKIPKPATTEERVKICDEAFTSTAARLRNITAHADGLLPEGVLNLIAAANEFEDDIWDAEDEAFEKHMGGPNDKYEDVDILSLFDLFGLDGDEYDERY